MSYTVTAGGQEGLGHIANEFVTAHTAGTPTVALLRSKTAAPRLQWHGMLWSPCRQPLAVRPPPAFEQGATFTGARA